MLPHTRLRYESRHTTRNPCPSDAEAAPYRSPHGEPYAGEATGCSPEISARQATAMNRIGIAAVIARFMGTPCPVSVRRSSSLQIGCSDEYALHIAVLGFGIDSRVGEGGTARTGDDQRGIRHRTIGDYGKR